MKKTRKISIFLMGSTLIMTGMGGNMPVKALDGVQQEVLTVAREAAEEFSVETNVLNAFLKINSVKYKDGTASGTVSVPKDGGWYIKRIVVAYMNYSQGISEAEADANLATLANNRDDNWKIVHYREYFPATAKMTQDFSLNQTQKDKDIFANKSDILYYAVEFGTIADEKWTETWWSRGKIDYRSCVHSTVFDEETMVCARVEEDGKVKYLPQMKSSGAMVTVPENEKVLTWEEEWKDVILWEYEEVQTEVERMWGYINDGLTVLDWGDLTLEGVLKSVKHYDEADLSLLWLSQSAEFFKGRIAEMRKFFEKDEVDTSKIETLEKENESLKQVSVTLESEKEALKQTNIVLENEKTTLMQKNEALEREILRLQAENEALKMVEDSSEKEDEDAMGEIKSLRQEIEWLMEEMTKVRQEADNLEVERTKVEMENAELQQNVAKVENERKELEKELEKGSAEMTDSQKCEVVNLITDVKTVEGNAEKVTDGQNENETEVMVGLEKENVEDDGVGVPILGGEEVKTSGAWWWLIPVVGLIGAMILTVKRKFSKE